MMDIRALCRQLVESADLAEVETSSFMDYHAIGARYVCLLRSPRLTVKAYIYRPGECSNDANGHLVAPHNHAYDFDTFVVCGRLGHRIFAEDPTGTGFIRANFHDRLSLPGAFNRELPPALSNSIDCGLAPVCTTWYGAGDHYSLDHRVVHTLSLPLDHTSPIVIVLLQYHRRVTRGWTYIYSPAGQPLPSTDLRYKRYRRDELIRDMALLRELFG